jgi:hypothetical protein
MKEDRKKERELLGGGRRGKASLTRLAVSRQNNKTIHKKYEDGHCASMPNKTRKRCKRTYRDALIVQT